MKISLIEAPICKGSPTVGTQFAYKHLTENGITELFGDEVCLVPSQLGTLEEGTYKPNMKYVGEVVSVAKEVYKGVKEAISTQSFPIVIGGDHSLAIGSIAGASACFSTEELSVIYIDGHTDINTENSTPTGFIHGMPLAAAMGLCSDKLTIGKKVNLLGKNIYIIGARSIDEGEYGIIRENGVHLYTADDVKKRGISSVMSEIKENISGGAVHISFDVDFLDEKVFPSTSYRMPNGLDIGTLKEILKESFSLGKTCSFDCVEYNPTLDTDGKDLKKLLDIFLFVSKLIEKNGYKKANKDF